MNAGVATPPGGLGLKLVRAYADELGYRDDGGTTGSRSSSAPRRRKRPASLEPTGSPARGFVGVRTDARIALCQGARLFQASVHARAISIG